VDNADDDFPEPLPSATRERRCLAPITPMAGIDAEGIPMDRKTTLATIVAVTATLLTGGLAAGATMGALNSVDTGGVGKAQLVEDATPAVAARVGTAVGDPQGSTGATPAGAPTAPERVAAPTTAAASSGVVMPAAAGHARSAPEVADHGTPTMTEPAPDPAPPTVTVPPPVTNPPPASCSGSDDGMTEAQKQAREAACQGGGDD
jgi:hypothetical protein